MHPLGVEHVQMFMNVVNHLAHIVYSVGFIPAFKHSDCAQSGEVG